MIIIRMAGFRAELVYTLMRRRFRDIEIKTLNFKYWRIMMTENKVAKKVATNSAFMKAMKPSEALSKIVGSDPLPRTEVTKKLWDYIKKNKLQDAKNKRNINADASLLAVFGGKKQVSMFEMAKLMNKHLS